jgi:hypothetical protein
MPALKNPITAFYFKICYKNCLQMNCSAGRRNAPVKEQ